MNELRARVIDVLRTVFDPEIPVNIFDLGLVYGIDVDEERHRVHVRLTLTAPSCPVAQTLPAAVADIIEQVEGVDQASVELVWEPPWSKGMMSEAARVQLGLV
jgi:FeS assembly SUF system protein